MQNKIKLEQLDLLCKEQNLYLCGVATLNSAQEFHSHFEEWQKSFSADLTYMQRDSQNYFEPARLLANAKSIVMVGAYYESCASIVLPQAHGRIARYAWGRDYHKALKRSLEKVAKSLSNEIQNFEYRIFSDAVPLVERVYAKNAGLGFIGKNSMLIRPRQGSFFLLAEMLTNLEINQHIPQLTTNCGSCQRCISNCPTQAIVKPYVIDANKCISYLTIEKRGMLSVNERVAIGEWIFGCDICQEVCPFNHRSQHHQAPKAFPTFERSNGTGPFISLSEILQIKDQAQFIERFAGSAIVRTKRQGLVRNAICVAHNTNAFQLLKQIESLAHSDADPIIRAHACWAAISMAEIKSEFSPQRIEKLKIRANSDLDLIG